jgi:SNF2 family DNA or RNA helicase
MNGLTLDLDNASNSVSLSGNTQAVWRSRRTAIFLRDYLKARPVLDGRIIIPVSGESLGPLLRSIEESLAKGGFEATRTEELSASVADFERAEEQFTEFSGRAKSIWSNRVPSDEFREFANTVLEKLPGRTLYDLQLLAAYHLAFAQNAANFSAPGVGKTTIVYGAFAYLNSLVPTHSKFVNKILVIGPLSSFGPWESEFVQCFSRRPLSHRLSGGALPDYRKRVLYSELPEFREAELVLTSYQSVANDLEHVQHFLTRPWNKVMVVLDEAHKIKNSSGGIWADAVLNLARFPAARVVLTGTPAPNGYEDLFNLFHFIWPEHDIIKFHLQHLKDMSQNPFDPRIERLVENLSPFFIRIRKSDLNLPQPIENPLVNVPMGDRQQRIYRFIEERYVSYWEGRGSDSWVKDTLAKARVIRLMQAASNPALLRTPLDEALLGEGADRTSAVFVDDSEILAEIQHYASNERPAKLTAAVELIQRILTEDHGNRVVVWCVFVANLFELRDMCQERGVDVRVLYGGTPTETDETEVDIETREKIVEEFQSVNSSFRVILANPAAVGESISLHKTCHHAIYVERNFNAAAFLQSKDRIHRYGLMPNAKVNYYYLVSQDTVDLTIHDRLLQKEAAMMKILESRDIPLISLNMDSGEGQDDRDDVRAIIRDYAKRRAASAITR